MRILRLLLSGVIFIFFLLFLILFINEIFTTKSIGFILTFFILCLLSFISFYKIKPNKKDKSNTIKINESGPQNNIVDLKEEPSSETEELIDKATIIAKHVTCWNDCLRIVDYITSLEKDLEKDSENEKKQNDYVTNKLALQIINFKIDSDRSIDDFSCVEKDDEIVAYSSLPLNIQYKASDGTPSERLIKSNKCFKRNNQWYLAGIDSTEGAVKSFRFDRIKKVDLQGYIIDDLLTFLRKFREEE